MNDYVKFSFTNAIFPMNLNDLLRELNQESGITEAAKSHKGG